MDGISMASLWSSQQAAADHETDQESFMISNGSDCFHSYGSKMGPADQDNIFYPIHQVLQKAQVSQLLQTSGLDHQEAPALPLGNSEAAPADYCHHHQFGMADIQSQQVVNNNNNSTACSSLDDQSLDCLLSATNSNTADTSVEDDDGISVLFSDCKNLWNYNFGSNNSNDNTAVSTGDSHENNTNAAIYNRVNEQEQQLDHQATVSHRGWRKRKNIDHQSEGGFKLISSGNNIEPRMKKRSRLEKPRPSSSNISFQQANDPNNNSSVLSSYVIEEPDPEAIAQMKEMIYRAAAFRPVNLGLEVVEKPKRKNVRISTDPQTVAARQRREKISERIRVLQRLVPGGIKMDTASMLDEAASYLKFLRSQVKALENLSHTKPDQNLAFSSLPFSFPMQTHFSLQNHSHNHQSS